MATTGLLDTWGRTATDLRVSLTDRCNLRCNYCMPAEGLDWLPTEEVLSDDEVVRLITIGVERLGIEEVRFTGGEPLLRRGLVDIVRRSAALAPWLESGNAGAGIARRRVAAALSYRRPTRSCGCVRSRVAASTARPSGS